MARHPYEGDAQDMDVAQRGVNALNNAEINQELQPIFTQTPSIVDPLKDVTLGSAGTPVEYDTATGGYKVTGEKASFETAELVRYEPGALNFIGLYLRLAGVPSDGQWDIGLGRIDYLDWVNNTNFTQDSDEVTLRLTSDGDWAFVIKRDGVETIMPQSSTNSFASPADGRSWDPTEFNGNEPGNGIQIDDQNNNLAGVYWAFDPMDGTGKSGLDLTAISDHAMTILPKLKGTWYGKGPWLLGFEVVGGGGYHRFWPAVMFAARRQAITVQPNQPVMVRYDDGGAGNSETAQVFGRQASSTSGFEGTPQTTFHFQDGLSITAPSTPIDESDIDNADLVIAYRRKPDSATGTDTNYEGTPFGLLELETQLNQRTLFYTCLDPTFGDTPDWIDPLGANQNDQDPIQVAVQDTGATDLTADGSTGRRYSSKVIGSGKNTTVAGDLDPIEQANPRHKAVGIFALSLTGSSADGDLLSRWKYNH